MEPARDDKRLEELLRDVLIELGLDPGTEGLAETPRRVAAYLREYHQPFDTKILGVGFTTPQNHHGMIVQSGIPFRMICEHHLLPATGTASIGYVPGKTVVGLSKLTRLVQAVGTEKPSLQEEVGDRIADILWRDLDPKGVIVVVSAEHSCMSARGVAAPGVLTMTSSIRGIFRDVPHARAEFFELIRRTR